MNDLGWIKYNPRAMYCDTSDMTAAGERAHRRLMDYIWFKDICPPANDELLRQITHTDPRDWGRAKSELSAHGWETVGAWFLHRKAIASLNEAKETHAANWNRTAPANKLPLKHLSPEPETGILREADVTPDVTSPVTTPTVTDTDTVTNTKGRSDKADQASKRELGTGNRKLETSPPHHPSPITHPLPKAKRELATRLEELLLEQWPNDAGKWIDRCKAHPGKVERVLADALDKSKTGFAPASPAAWLEDLWQRFK